MEKRWRTRGVLVVKTICYCAKELGFRRWIRNPTNEALLGLDVCDGWVSSAQALNGTAGIYFL